MLGAQRRKRARMSKGDLVHMLVQAVGGVPAPFPQYAQDPVGFALDVLEVKYLTVKQREILEHVRDHRETNVPAGYNVGKTFVASILVVWWVFAVGGKCVTTAPTSRQVKSLLWHEVRTLYDRVQLKLGGERGVTTLYLSEQAQAWGFTASAHSEDSAAGIHAEKLLAIIDEANGVLRNIDDAFKGWIGGVHNRGLRIGNPTKDGTPFASACARDAIPISVFDHPNVAWAYNGEVMKPEVAAALMVTDSEGRPHVRARSEWPSWCPVEPIVPAAISVEWIEETRQDIKNGPGSVYWQGRVLGLFPSDASTSLLPRPWFLAARRRYDRMKEEADRDALEHPWEHGLDVGDGHDDTVLASRRGYVLYEVQVRPTKGDRRDNARAVALVLSTLDGGAQHPHKMPGKVKVDYIGVGAGVLSNLLEAEVNAVGVHFGRKAASKRDQKRFANTRASRYWAVRELAETDELLIAPLGNKVEHRLMEEFANTTWDEDLQGRVILGSKDKLRELLGGSPDTADAVVLAFTPAGSSQDHATHF